MKYLCSFFSLSKKREIHGFPIPWDGNIGILLRENRFSNFMKDMVLSWIPGNGDVSFLSVLSFPFCFFQIREKTSIIKDLDSWILGFLDSMVFEFHEGFGWILGFCDFVIFPFSLFHFPKREKSMDSIPWDGNIGILIERKPLLDLPIPNPFS